MEHELEGAWIPNNILALKAVRAGVLTLGPGLVSEARNTRQTLTRLNVLLGEHPWHSSHSQRGP